MAAYDLKNPGSSQDLSSGLTGRLRHRESTVTNKRIDGTTRRRVAACFEKERPYRQPPAESLVLSSGAAPCLARIRRAEVAKGSQEAPPERRNRNVWVHWDARRVCILPERMDQVALYTRLEPGRFSHSLSADG